MKPDCFLFASSGLKESNSQCLVLVLNPGIGLPDFREIRYENADIRGTPHCTLVYRMCRISGISDMRTLISDERNPALYTGLPDVPDFREIRYENTDIGREELRIVHWFTGCAGFPGDPV